MTTENTALTVQARAALALESSTAETYLTELAVKSKAITAITNKDGRTECHAAAMTAKEARVSIEKAGKSAREDATAFSKAVISEEARLVALIKPEETRLIELRDEWDAKVKAEKEAAEALERQRIEAIKARIAEFGAMVTDAAMLEAHGADQELEVALAVEINDSFGEFYGDAVEAKATAVAKLREIVAAKTAAEATAARIKSEQEAEAARLAEEAKRLAAEREELARLRAEAEARRKEEEAKAAEQPKPKPTVSPPMKSARLTSSARPKQWSAPSSLPKKPRPPCQSRRRNKQLKTIPSNRSHWSINFLTPRK